MLVLAVVFEEFEATDICFTFTYTTNDKSSWSSNPLTQISDTHPVS